MKNKLCLGTVQLGTRYGIKNELGRQPTDKESFAVLRRAIDSGIEYFDTASIYGDAERILGDFGIGNYPVNVISKLKPNLESDEKIVLNEICDSLGRLQMQTLYGYMLHRASDFYRKEIMNGLRLAKERGLIKNIGVSIYEPEDALRIVSDKSIDCIQIPYSVLDQRLDQTDFFELAEKNHIRVFARSAFLQGLLLMKPEDVPVNLKPVVPLLQRFNNIIKRYEFSNKEAAFLFSYCHIGISNLVFGVDTADQLVENWRTIVRSREFADCFKDLYGAFVDVDRRIIIPSLW